MYVFLFLAITILILITVVIIQSRDKSTKKPTNPTTDPPVTTDPPACTKYKYDKECLDTCGEKYVNETEKTCYNDIPQGKYADGKILLDNCIESINNKYTYNKTCVLNCDPYNYVDTMESKCYDDIPQDKYLASDGKTIVLSCNNNDYVDKTNRICYNYFPNDIYYLDTDNKTLVTSCGNNFANKTEKKCLTSTQLSPYIEVDNVKITNNLDKFITNTSDVISPMVFYENNIDPGLIASTATDFIDLKMSSSGSVYAKVYKNKIEIFVQDLFNQANVLPKYTIRVPQDITGLDPTLEVEDFNFCGEDNILTILSQGIIVCKSTDTTTPGKFKKIMYLLIIYNNNYETILLENTNTNLSSSYGEYNINNGEIFNIHNPVHLGTRYYQQDVVRRDLFSVCSSFSRDSTNSSVSYIQFYINYNFPNSPFTPYPIFEPIGDIPPIYDLQYSNLNKYENINVKSTYNIIAKLKLYSDNSFKLDMINNKGSYNSLLSNENVVSNIAVGCFISNYINTVSNDSTETIYYVKRENSILKLQKYKYISSSNSTTNIVAYEFPVSSSNAYVYLTSNRDGSILAIGIHDGNTKSLWKYTEATNTVSKIL